MDKIIEKYDNCYDPEKYVSLMYEDTDKETGMLCFHGLWHELDDDEVYRFHMNWNQKDVEKLKADHKALVESLAALSKIESELTEANASVRINDEKLMNVWNTYTRPFTGDAKFTDEISDILDKYENIEMVARIRRKVSNNEELSDYEKDMLADFEDSELTEEEERILDKYEDARNREAEKRVGKSLFAYSFINQAWRLCRLLGINAPEIIIKNETRELITAMALHRHCDNMEEIK